MSKQVQEAYIVAATRTPIGKSGRGYFRNTRPDDLLVAAALSALKQVPTLDPKAIEDAIEKAVSGAVWDAAKAVGLGKLVKDVVDDATHDLNKAVNSLHLNPDMNLAGLDKLQELTAMADAVIDLEVFAAAGEHRAVA